MTATLPIRVVLPTFNEAENLGPLSAAVLAAAPEGTGILVVDDASPDGTGELADRLAAADRRIDVLHRSEKLGLGPAYVAGFAWALASGAERIVQMDADFSHDPADVPRLIAATMDGDSGADLALGSRYVAGGGVGDWGSGRQAISRWGSIYARTWLGLELHDLTGGFKCYRARGARGDPPGDGQRARLRVPDRDDLPRGPGRIPRRRGPDHLQRPAGGGVEDEPGDRRGGRMASADHAVAGRPLGLTPSQYFILCSKVYDSPRITHSGVKMANLPQVTDNNFQAEVLDAGEPVLVDFWAPWCGPCRVVHPILEEMSGERDDVKIVSVNIDENQETAGKYQVMSIPTMIVFKGGQPAKTIVGAMPKKRLEAEIEPALA